MKLKNWHRQTIIGWGGEVTVILIVLAFGEHPSTAAWIRWGLLASLIAVGCYFQEKPIALLIFLAKRCGDVATLFSRAQSFLGRTQTKLLTAAQHRGWLPETPEAANRLARRQFQLFLFRTDKARAKKQQADRTAKL